MIMVMVSLECLGRDEFYNMLKIIFWLQIVLMLKNCCTIVTKLTIRYLDKFVVNIYLMHMDMYVHTSVSTSFYKTRWLQCLHPSTHRCAMCGGLFNLIAIYYVMLTHPRGA